MKELRLILNERLSQLETESELIDEAIQEIHRRFSVLNDVELWGLLPETDEVLPAIESTNSEIIEEEELDLVNGEQEEESDFAVSEELDAEQALGADGSGPGLRELFQPPCDRLEV